MEEKKYGEDNVKSYSDVFFLMLLYQIYILYKNGYVYQDIKISDIFITNDLFKKDYLRIELGFKINKKIIIDYKNGKFNFYGNKPIILNLNIKESKNNDDFIKSIKQLYDIFIKSNIIKQINFSLNYPDMIYDFINKIGNDYISTKNITLDNNNILDIHTLILQINNVKLNNFQNTFEFLYNKILEKKSDLLKEINKYTTIIIPKNTNFASATSFDVINFDDSKKKYMLENNWNYRYKNSNWFVSNYDLDDKIFTTDYNNINYKKLNGANSDFYIKQEPSKLSHHLIFKNNRDIKMLVTEFDGIKRLIFHKKILSIIYDNIFDDIPVMNADNTFNTKLNDEFKKYNILSPDSYVVFSMNVLIENNLLDIDGYIGMDWVDKYYDCVNSSTTIEYLLLKPNYLNLIGLYYYDYYDNNFKLFLSNDEWNKFIIDKIKKINISNINLLKMNDCQSGSCVQSNCKQNIIYDYAYIAKQYIKYLTLILDDNFILANNSIDDFEDSNNKMLVYYNE